MNNLKNYALILGLLFLGIACQNNPVNGWKELSLLKYGIPITVMAPDSAKINTMDFGLQRDITIQKDDNYSIQIYASDASTTDVNKVKEQQLAMLKENPYFARVVQDDDTGFIYENKIDSTNLNYGFRLIKIKGDKEYIFQTGLIGAFTEDQVRSMYEAVQAD